jgi:RimJ/RimL family protein N-acetyltransferase
VRIIAMTVPANTRSQAVMQRIGMQRRPDLDFDHPLLAPGNPLRPHIATEICR